MTLYPKAAQAIMTETGLRSPKDWQDYLTTVKTGLGAWDDARTQGQIFAAGQRAIPMPTDFDGLPDYAAYFRHIEEYRNAIEEQHGENGIATLNAELMSVMSPMQREYYTEVGLGAQQGGLRTYWDIANNIAMREPGLQGHVYRLFLNSNDDARRALKLQYADLISNVQRKVNRERQIYRQRNPMMDYLYVKWGYAEAGQTLYGEFGLQERIARGYTNLGLMTQADPTQPVPQAGVLR